MFSKELHIKLINEVCRKLDVSVEYFLKTRKREIIDYKHILRKIYCQYFRLSSTKCGELLKCDHSTVLNSLLVTSDLMETETEFRKKYHFLTKLAIDLELQEQEVYYGA